MGTKKEEALERERWWALQYVLQQCHRFHTLFVHPLLFLSSGRCLSGEFDSLITGESKLDSTIAANHKGSSGVASHSFMQAHYNVYQMDTARDISWWHLKAAVAACLPGLEKMKVTRETGGRLRQTETDLINNCTEMKSKWLKHVAWGIWYSSKQKLA